MSEQFSDPRKLIDELRKLTRAYVSLLETGRDRIIAHGGTCDSVEEMERGDPALSRAKMAIDGAEIELRHASVFPAQRASELLEDVENLRHMLGATYPNKQREWGYRNYYCANLGDKSMERLEQAGLVIKGRVSSDQAYYHATETGCKLAGLDARQIRRALSRDE